MMYGFVGNKQIDEFFSRTENEDINVSKFIRRAVCDRIDKLDGGN